MKRYGKLAGHTYAEDALLSVSPTNKDNRYGEVSAASKLLAFGEPITHISVNRMMGALESNIEEMHNLLSAPSLRMELLTPRGGDESMDGGFSCLDTSPGVSGMVNLGAAGCPSAWVYVGLHEDQVNRYVKLYRAAVYANDDSMVTKETLLASPSMLHQLYTSDTLIENVRVNSAAGAPYHPAQSYVGSSYHSLPDYVAHIVPVASDLAPYNGDPQYEEPVVSWVEDGPVIGVSFESLLLRPGCFVEIQDAHPTNNGLFRIANIKQSTASGKAILTRGGYHKVTVASGALFVAGERISWRSVPDHADGGSSSNERTNFAYVMHVISNDLYLAELPATDDFPVSGFGNKSTIDNTNYIGRNYSGGFGEIDNEDLDEDSSNAGMPVGTMLFNVAGVPSEITAVTPSYAPLKFEVDTALYPGQILIPMCPPGFLLNPALTVATDEGSPASGGYYVQCSTMSTVREKMLAPGASAVQEGVEDPSSIGLNPLDIAFLKAHLQFTHGGYEAPTVSMDVNGWYSPTNQVLGADIWEITLDANLALYLATNAESPDIGVAATFVRNTTQSTDCWLFGTRGVKAYAHLLNTESWTDKATLLTGATNPLLAVGDVATITVAPGGPTPFTIVSIERTNAMDSATGAYYPSYGLNAAYHNDFSSHLDIRGQRGHGNRIALYPNKPVTFVVPDIADATEYDALNILTDNINTGILKVKSKSGGQVLGITSSGDGYTTVDAVEELVLEANSGVASVTIANGSGAERVDVSSDGTISTESVGDTTIESTGGDVDITASVNVDIVATNGGFTAEATNGILTLTSDGDTTITSYSGINIDAPNGSVHLTSSNASDMTSDDGAGGVAAVSVVGGTAAVLGSVAVNVTTDDGGGNTTSIGSTAGGITLAGSTEVVAEAPSIALGATAVSIELDGTSSSVSLDTADTSIVLNNAGAVKTVNITAVSANVSLDGVADRAVMEVTDASIAVDNSGALNEVTLLAGNTALTADGVADTITAETANTSVTLDDSGAVKKITALAGATSVVVDGAADTVTLTGDTVAISSSHVTAGATIDYNSMQYEWINVPTVPKFNFVPDISAENYWDPLDATSSLPCLTYIAANNSAQNPIVYIPLAMSNDEYLADVLFHCTVGPTAAEADFKMRWDVVKLYDAESRWYSLWPTDTALVCPAPAEAQLFGSHSTYVAEPNSWIATDDTMVRHGVMQARDLGRAYVGGALWDRTPIVHHYFGQLYLKLTVTAVATIPSIPLTVDFLRIKVGRNKSR